jgi:putative PIN family toxin of toxin-antitoxin system
MGNPKVVIDTNVVVSALKSNLGASHVLFRLVGTEKFEICLSVPLLIEYERALSDPKLKLRLKPDEVKKILNFLCANSTHHEIYFLWRPFIPDPGDDMLLELAVASGTKTIVTFNKRDFRGISKFGVKAITPKEFLKNIGEL